MNDAEEFDELAKRQGAWGGGYQAKRKAAADKLWDKPSVAFDEWWNGDNDESTNPFRLESGAYWAWAGWKAALAQPVQPQQDESDLLTIAYQSGFYDGKKAALAQPAQKPVALVIDGVLSKSALPEKYTGHLYTAPPQRKWVGLTDEDCKGMSAGDKMVAMWANRILRERNS